MFFFIFSTDINSMAYSKTYHVFRICYFAFKHAKNSNLVIAVQLKSLPGFPKSLHSVLSHYVKNKKKYHDFTFE